jgi:hypothetical protein
MMVAFPCSAVHVADQAEYVTAWAAHYAPGDYGISGGVDR